jgi:hypothetical protein
MPGALCWLLPFPVRKSTALLVEPCRSSALPRQQSRRCWRQRFSKALKQRLHNQRSGRRPQDAPTMRLPAPAACSTKYRIRSDGTLDKIGVVTGLPVGPEGIAVN